MPAVAPYIPPKDSALANWATNFSGLITASPAMFGLTSVDAGNISSVVSNFLTAYGLVTSPMTKTAQAVSNKNTAKVNMLAVVRPYAQQISLNPGVSSANKIAVGVNPRTSTPSPVTPPVTNPILTVQSAQNLSVILRYRDSVASPSVKSKPYGVTSCQIVQLISATPVTDPTLMGMPINATKSPLTVTFPSGAGGKQVYFASRWAIRTGGFGPWSAIINTTVPIAM